jgi:hypothetical protein
MTNYTRITDFTSKDALATGNPSKVILGSEHQAEFDSIATHIATKQDGINTLSTETTTDTAADFLSFYDNSAGSHKKILVDNIRKDVFNKTRLSAWRAASAASTSLSTGVETTITLAETYDYGNNCSSGTYTAPYTGLYFISGNVYVSGTPASNSTLTCYIGVNASNYYIGVTLMESSINQVWCCNGSVVIGLTAGDTVVLRATQNSGATLTASAGNGNYIQGFFIRELS